MNYLLDTNVVSEWARPRPDIGVIEWLESVGEEEIHLSVATIAELRFGVALLPPSLRRSRLDRWLQEELLARFAERVLPIGGDVALAWGEVRAERQRAGNPISAMDAMIAATARVHGLSLVTRNARNFVGSVSAIVNPWAVA